MLGTISAVVPTDSTLFVFDRSTCEVVVFSRRTHRATHRFGRCGRGPSDLGYVTAMTIANDTLIMTDRAGEWLSLWTTDGTPLASRRIELSDTTWMPSHGLSSLGTGALALSVALRGNRGRPDGRTLRSQGAALLQFVDLHGRQLRPGLFVDGDGPELQTENLERTMVACASRDRNGNTYAAGVNMWVPQMAIANIDPHTPTSPILRYHAQFVDIPQLPVKQQTPPGSFRPGGASRVVFDENMVVASITLDRSTDSTSHQTTWVAFDLQSNTVSASTIARPGTDWFGSVRAIHGQSAFVVQHDMAEYPRVYEVRLAP